MNIGILALQGAYQAHATYLKKLQVASSFIRYPEQLKDTTGLIIPGGESATFIKLLSENKLWTALKNYQKPILGTCAGAILLSKEVSSPKQESLNRISMHIERNSYGRQLASQIALGDCLFNNETIEMLLIRAPKIIAIDEKKVRLLVTYQNQPMAVQENNCIATTFHPELSRDNSLHNYFIQQVKNSSYTN